MSINSVLGTARLALLAQETAIQTASHNIANASVAGYSRQVADLQPNVPMQTPWGMLGTGVVVNDVTRVRDQILDGNYRTQSAQSGAASTRRDILTSVSNVYGEPSSTGLASTLDQFWGAWSDLANTPTSTAAQSVVQQRGAQVASTLNRYATSLDQITATNRDQLAQQVTDFNRYATQVAQLNGQIVAAEAGGKQAPDLLDQRDKAIDAMATLAPVRVIQQPNGSATLYVSGATVVDGVTTRSLSLDQSGSTGTLSVLVQGRTTPLVDVGGSIGATATALNVDIPAQRSQLDQLAARIVTTVNTIHRTGWTANGDAAGGANWDPTKGATGSNIDFFDPTKTTAATMALSTQVANDASFVAAGNVQNATGNNAVALQIAGLRDATTSIPTYGVPGQTTSFDRYYQDQVTRLGVATADATASATVADTLVQQIEAQRQSVSGVSTDDELIQLTQRQQAYAAAAKVITTADQMSQTLLSLIP